MNATIKTMTQAIALVAIGGAVGLAANRFRDDRLAVDKDYFPVREVYRGGASDVQPDKAPSGATAVKPKHDLQVVTIEDVVSAFNDPSHKPGESDSKIFFIDARDDANFNEAHIPGALQVDHYRSEKYLPDVLPMLDDAEKIIVYCNGGTCEDSILVCHDLMDQKVPYEKLYLFEGGMKAWKDAKQPIE